MFAHVNRAALPLTPPGIHRPIPLPLGKFIKVWFGRLPTFRLDDGKHLHLHFAFSLLSSVADSATRLR